MREIKVLKELLENQNLKGDEIYSSVLAVYEGAERQFALLCGGNCGGLEEYCLSEVGRWMGERNEGDY